VESFLRTGAKAGLRQNAAVNCFVAAALSVADEPFFDGSRRGKVWVKKLYGFPCIKGKPSDL